jgi:hypothetical protein
MIFLLCYMLAVRSKPNLTWNKHECTVHVHPCYLQFEENSQQMSSVSTKQDVEISMMIQNSGLAYCRVLSSLCIFSVKVWGVVFEKLPVESIELVKFRLEWKSIHEIREYWPEIFCVDIWLILTFTDVFPPHVDNITRTPTVNSWNSNRSYCYLSITINK